MEAVQALPLSGWFGRPSSNRWTLAGSEGTPAYPCDRGDPVAQLTRKGFGSTPIKDAEPQRLMARRTGSSRSQDAVSSLCSSGWSALRTFGDRMRSLDKRGLNDGPGPFQAPRCTPTDVSEGWIPDFLCKRETIVARPRKRTSKTSNGTLRFKAASRRVARSGGCHLRKNRKRRPAWHRHDRHRASRQSCRPSSVHGVSAGR